MAISGSFSQNGRPTFPIEVYGYSPRSKIQVDAVLDTGFSGFLDLPLEHCLRSGLILMSTATYTLADERPVNVLLCIGTVMLGSKRVVGPISINMSGRRALLGTDFLRKARVRLEVDPINDTTKLIRTRRKH